MIANDAVSETTQLEWLADQGARFALPYGRTKNKFEMDWPNKPHTLKEAVAHGKAGGNVGVLTGKHSSDIVALDRDIDFPQTVAMLGDLGKTAKIIRSNAPERGKLLYRVAGDTPQTVSWKPEGEKRPHAEFLGDNGQRHALCPPSMIDGGEYRLIDTEYGIQSITPNELDYIWRLITGGSIYKDVRAQEEAEAEKQAKDEYVKSVKSAWTVTTVFDHFDKAKNGTAKDRGETRLLGNGGLLISADGTQWYDHADSIGGDALDAWAWCRWKKRVDRKSPKMFWDTIDDMAGAKGIVKALPAKKIYTNGVNGNSHNQANDDDYAKEPEAGASTDENALLKEGAHDEGNAQCVHIRHKGKFLHSESLGWLAHTGTHWAMDEAEATVERAITDTLIARLNLAIKAELSEDRIRKFIPNSGRMQGAKIQMRSLVSVAPEKFDTEPDYLNCKNGVVNLRTGELFSHSTAQRFMHCTAVNYLPDADYSLWSGWLTDAVGPAMADWLQMAVGYSLTGHTREEVLFYLFGPPRSGKGTFTETLLNLLGVPLAKEVSFSMFLAQRTGDSQNFDLAPLKPTRFLAASESNSYERFNEAKIKALTGGNEVYCAFKHRNHFNYRPQFKIWLSSNQPVNADPDDEAVWGRLRVIEFPHSHLGNEDKSLKHNMRSPEALQGVLSWAIAGAMRWYRLGSAGLPEIEGSAKTKSVHRSELDNVQAWLDECCSMADAFSPYSALYNSYELWCKANGVEPKKQKGFSQSLIHKNFVNKTARSGNTTVKGFQGLRVL